MDTIIILGIVLLEIVAVLVNVYAVIRFTLFFSDRKLKKQYKQWKAQR